MLMGVLEAGTEQLVAHVFEAASLLTWLVTAPVEVQPPGRAEDSGRQERRPLRAGAPRGSQCAPRCRRRNALYEGWRKR